MTQKPDFSGPKLSRRGLLGPLVPLVAAVSLSACGFKLREAPTYAFSTIFVRVGEASTLGNELRRNLEGSGNIEVITDTARLNSAQVILDVTGDQREKTAVGLNSSGQVREFQLRLRFKFKVRNQKGDELIPEVELLQQRDMTYSESQASAKEGEEQLLYRNMQSAIVQQVIRRLGAIKAI
nr:LPS assembly lipoprotein LptE [Rhodoferax koreense]